MAYQSVTYTAEITIVRDHPDNREFSKFPSHRDAADLIMAQMTDDWLDDTGLFCGSVVVTGVSEVRP